MASCSKEISSHYVIEVKLSFKKFFKEINPKILKLGRLNLVFYKKKYTKNCYEKFVCCLCNQVVIIEPMAYHIFAKKPMLC